MWTETHETPTDGNDGLSRVPDKREGGRHGRTIHEFLHHLVPLIAPEVGRRALDLVVCRPSKEDSHEIGIV